MTILYVSSTQLRQFYTDKPKKLLLYFLTPQILVDPVFHSYNHCLNPLKLEVYLNST
jgi:hypothetical protein